MRRVLYLHMDITKVNRFEIIDVDGRRYVNLSAAGLELSLQDNGETLKVFLKTFGKTQNKVNDLNEETKSFSGWL